MPIILLRRLKQEDYKFQASLDYIVNPPLRKTLEAFLCQTVLFSSGVPIYMLFAL